MRKQDLPKGWTEGRIRKVIAHYDSLTDKQWAAEDEAAFADPRMTVMLVPTELVPNIAGLITQHEAQQSANRPRKRKTSRKPAKKGRRTTAQKAAG